MHNLCARVNMRRMLNNAAKLHVKYKLLMPSCGENIDILHNLFYSNSDPLSARIVFIARVFIVLMYTRVKMVIVGRRLRVLTIVHRNINYFCIACRAAIHTRREDAKRRSGSSNYMGNKLNG